jgi:hypothetical protein
VTMMLGLLGLWKRCLGSVVALVLRCHGMMAVAAFDGCVMLCSLLANFAGLCVPRPQRWLYSTKSTRGDACWLVETVAATGKRILMLL